MNEGCGRTISVPGAIGGLIELLGEQKTADLPEELRNIPRTPVEFRCCTIVKGDCRDYLWALPKQFFDLVITDPPYGMNIKLEQKHHEKVEWDKEFPVNTVWVMKFSELARLGSYFFCRWDNVWDHEKRTPPNTVALPKPKSLLVWHKLDAGSRGDVEHEHSTNFEMIFFYPGPEHKFKKRPKSVLRHKPSGNTLHTTQKPVKLIQEMMRWYDFDTVLDPFMGSGTTAVAALLNHKHFLGFEANEGNYSRAIRRVDDIAKRIREKNLHSVAQ